MNKGHQMAEEIPYEPPKEKKKYKYLFIESDEDHVAEQHGRWYKGNGDSKQTPSSKIDTVNKNRHRQQKQTPSTKIDTLEKKGKK